LVVLPDSKSTIGQLLKGVLLTFFFIKIGLIPAA